MSTQLKLPAISNRTTFNLKRWDELAHRVEVRAHPGKVETNRFGHAILHRFVEFSHGCLQAEIGGNLDRLKECGKALVECPISTPNGVKVADVAWISKARLVKVGGRAALKGAPEICVEVVSRANTQQEIDEKKRLYFEAGAHEVWICDRKGKMFFFTAGQPAKASAKSVLCPDMPRTIA